MRSPRKLSVALAMAALTIMALPQGATAQSSETTGAVSTTQQRGASGLPLPRFVSLRGNQVNARVGPGLNYAIEWRYLKPGMPMEIIQEYDNWRRVRDADGGEGWINQALLSGQRTAVAAPWQRGQDTTLPLLAEPNTDARTVALMEPGVVGNLRMCNGHWCEMEVSGVRGWIRQTQIWGAYPGETYRD